MPRRRSTKIGRLSPPLDVRSDKDVKNFENMLSIGPLTIVLVYADWCGHCTRFKETMWNDAVALPNKSMNTASVHYDMLDKTSLANSKIEGYPSLLMVGTDKKAADFKEEETGSITNAMPQPTSAEELKTMLETPLPTPGPVKNANSVVKTIINNARKDTLPTESAVKHHTMEEAVLTPEGVEVSTNVRNTKNMNMNSANMNMPVSANVATPASNKIPVSPTTNIVNLGRVNNVTPARKNNNSYVPAEASTLTTTPPDPLTDLVESQQSQEAQKGGSLMESLLRITGEAAHVGLLLTAASAMAHRRRSRGSTKSKRKHAARTRKQRK